MSSIPLPRNCDKDVIDRLWAVEREDGFDPAFAEELLAWLKETEFDSRNFWVGEIAATLIRDRGPSHLRDRLKDIAQGASEWHMFLYLTALRRETDWSEIEPSLDRA